MSRIDDFLIEYDYTFGLWEEEKALRYIELQMLLSGAKRFPIDPNIAEFFHGILAEHEKKKFWLMLSDSVGNFHFCYHTIEETIAAATALTEERCNLYFSPATFRGWRDDDHVCCVKSLFLDIDDVEGTDFSEMGTEAVSTWLKNTYDIPKELLPSWVVASGHGLHLYYQISELNLETTEGCEQRRKYTDYLIRFFRADIACRNKSRILRVPGSYNTKHEEVKTRLHRLNADKVFTFEELDFFAATDGEIREYMRQSQDAKNAKSRATRERHKLEKLAAGIPLKPAKAPKLKAKSSASWKKEMAEAEYQDKGNRERAAKIGKEIKYRRDFDPHSRQWNLIKDLNNYYCRHNGQIQGHRNQFVHLLAVLLKPIMLVNDAIDYILPYVEEDFEEEAVRTIEAAYANPKQYRYRYDTIAELLGFDSRDILASYCNFSEERQMEAREWATKKAHRREAAKRKAQRNTKERRRQQREAVKYSGLSVRELAELLGVSERTIKRIRRELRSEN